MAIVQISKIQHRSGNLVDLPQLDEAELGWASDAKLLFIGKTNPNENIEVITSYSNISFSQLEGSQGNLNIINAEDGQVLAFDGNNWINRGGNAGGLLTLGSNTDVKITGGSAGFTLETDGLGNLSWTPKGTIVSMISEITAISSPSVETIVTTTEENFFTERSYVTITDIGSNSMTELNGRSFYVNVITSTTFSLYLDPALSIPVDATSYTPYQPDSGGRVICSVGGGSAATVGGSNRSVQFNNSNLLDGSSDFTYNAVSGVLTVVGNVVFGNASSNNTISANVLVSNIVAAPPLIVKSSLRVANLNVSYSNVSDYEVVTAKTSGTYYPVFVNGNTTANYGLGSNSNLSFDSASGALSATLFTGTLTTAAQPNVTSVGTLTGLTVDGTVTTGNIVPSANIIFNLGSDTRRWNNLYLSGNTIYLGNAILSEQSNTVTVSGFTVTGNAEVGNINAIGTISGSNIFGNTIISNGIVSATGNVSGGNLTTAGKLSVTGNANVGNIGAIEGVFTGNITGNYLLGNGAYLTGIDAGGISNGTSNVKAFNNANVTISVAGTANVVVVSNTGINVTGNIAVSGKSNLGPIGNLILTGGSANQLLRTDGAGNLTWSDPTGGYYLHSQVVPSSTWTVVHNLNNRFVSVTPIDSTGNSYEGRYDFPTIIYNNANVVTLTFNSAVIGYVAVVGGGIVYSNGSSTTTPAGFDTYVQFNDSGNMGANSTFTFTKSTGILTTGGIKTDNYYYANGLPISFVGAYSNSNVASYLPTYEGNLGLAGGNTVFNGNSANISGNTVTGGIKTDNYYYANGVSISFVGAYSNSNVASYLPTYEGNLGLVGGNAIFNGKTITTGANTTSGLITGNWTLTVGSKLEATFSDLAEYYTADNNYESGTVLEFGGELEVTIATEKSRSIAGVVSTDPAYVMNSACPGEFVAAIALQGRVPCKVRGPIRKGDMMISAGDGYARACANPTVGSVIGKSLETFSGIEGIIEVAVGRL